MSDRADRPPLSRGWLVATVAVALVVALAIVVVNAPANWLAGFVARQTGQRILLADAQGTIWAGSAVVAVGAAEEPAVRQRAAERLALPGRVTWTLELTRLLAPVLHLTHDGVLARGLVARYVDGGLTLDPGSAVLSASLLRLVGAPLNSLSPEGQCTLQWSGLRIDASGVPVGAGTLRIDGLALALSPVRPLGDYLVTWTSGATGLTWSIATQRGPLSLAGNGRVAGSRLQAHVVVRAFPGTAAPVVAQLGPLLEAIGRRGPNEAIIDTGAS